MTSQKRFDEQIPRLLLELSDDEVVESDSDVEDDLLEDDVQTDFEAIPGHVPQSTVFPNADNVEHKTSTVPVHNSVINTKRQTLANETDHRWTDDVETSGDTPATNIIRGPTETARNLIEPVECFSAFIKEEILVEITEWTNVQIEMKLKKSDTKATFKTTTVDEIRALIGILTLTAAMKDNHLTTDELFDCTYSGSRYVAAMSRDRFDFLIRNMRMNIADPVDADTFQPLRKIWEIFINQCRLSYNPGPCVTLAERFLAFRGRCPFRVYVPNKPSRSGIKLFVVCDSTTRYMIDAAPYLGRCIDTNGLPLADFVAIELTKTIHGTNRNVTCDSWFTSVQLAKSLLAPPYNLTLVGAIRSNRPEIPDELKTIRSSDVGHAIFYLDGPVTLLSYKPQRDKAVFLLSSYDEQKAVGPSAPELDVVRFHGETKRAVATFARMCASMSCSRKTGRWPTAIFYHMLNIAFVNSYVIHCHNVATERGKPMERRVFMKTLSNSLMGPWIAKRQAMPNLSSSLKGIMSSVALKRPTDRCDREGAVVERKRQYCAYCPPKLRRMTKTVCDKCNLAICGEHKTTSCVKCFEY